ncbi:nuclear transport factor 2 family protein [Limimaricola variabilis]
MGSDRTAYETVQDFLNEYNKCFYSKDIGALRSMYSSEAFAVFWDNHAGCDSHTLDDHFEKISTFLQEGRSTEGGEVEELIVEDKRIRTSSNFSLVTAILRYRSAPMPGVRSTFVLVREKGRWKAIHIHHSFDPNDIT